MQSIEETIFTRKKWQEDKMLAYGFNKNKNTYTLEKTFLDGDFLAILTVTSKGKVMGKVIDQMTQDEYYQLYQLNATGAYVNTVRAAYTDLLKNIANECCDNVLFYSSQANRLTQNILKRFQVEPDFPWEHAKRYQNYGTFRHTASRKWFALIMNIKRTLLDKNNNAELIDIINVKIKPDQAENLQQNSSIYPAYHMNHKLWISIVLDSSLSDEKIMTLIEDSYKLTQ